MTDAVADATPPKKGERRKRQGQTLVRWDHAEGEVVSEAAERTGLSMAEFFRSAAVAAATGGKVPRAVRRPPEEKAALVRLLGLAGNISGNTNQLARAVNTTGDYPAIAELTSIRENLVLLRRDLMHALGRGPSG
jgi:hypothetical protein